MITDIREKERKAESKFKEWLDKNNTPYWYIQQDIASFSPALKKYMTKRPDFIILLPNIGFIITDVEYKPTLEKYEKFPVDVKETKSYINLQKYFNLQVWYVFSSDKSHFNTWYWIPVQKVVETKEIYLSKKDRNEYFSVPMSQTIQISKDDSLNRLFSKISAFYK